MRVRFTARHRLGAVGEIVEVDDALGPQLCACGVAEVVQRDPPDADAKKCTWTERPEEFSDAVTEPVEAPPRNKIVL